MKLKDILSITYTAFSKLSASSLIKAFQSLREKYIKLEKENNALKAENERLIALLKKQKIQSINKDANKPSSKRPEWNKSGAGNDRKEKKNGKGRGKKPRKGAGNRPKKLNLIAQKRQQLIIVASVAKIYQRKRRLKPAIAESLRTFRMLLKNRQS